MKNVHIGITLLPLRWRSSAAASGGGGGGEVKIGHVGPLTGGIAHLGKDNENGARLAVEEANAAKIKIDGKDVKFEFVRRGRPGRPEGRHHRRAEAGRRQGRRRRRPPELRHLDPGLADLQPGRHPGDLGLGHQPQADRAGLQDRSSASSAATTSRARRSRATSPANNKPKTVAIIDDATAYGEGIANEVEKTLKAAKRQRAAAREGHRQDNRLQGDPHQAARARNPDAVFYGGMDATGGPMLKQARELGIKAVFAFGDGACTDEMAKLAGAAAEGLLCSQAGLPAQAAEQEVPRRVQEEVQRRPDPLRAVHLRRGQPADRGDAEGGLDRPGEVPAGAGEDRATRAPPARSRSTTRATARTPR